MQCLTNLLQEGEVFKAALNANAKEGGAAFFVTSESRDSLWRFKGAGIKWQCGFITRAVRPLFDKFESGLHMHISIIHGTVAFTYRMRMSVPLLDT
jgi:hypothetical protein